MKQSTKIILILIILLGGFFAISKGWAIFASLPFWLITTPLIWHVSQKFSKTKALTQISNLSQFLFYLYPVTYLLTLACMVGFGDTQSVIAFGFFTVDGSSTIANLSQIIAYISFGLFVALSFYIFYELHAIKNKINPSSKNSKVFMTVFITAVLILLIMVANAIYGHYHQTFYCNGVAVAHGSKPPPNYCP